jgi:hypothetical protein
VAREHQHITVGSSTQHHRLQRTKLATASSHPPPTTPRRFRYSLSLPFLPVHTLTFSRCSPKNILLFPLSAPQPFPLRSACLSLLLHLAGTPRRPETSGLRDEKPENILPEILPVLLITPLSCSWQACSSKPSLAQTAVVPAPSPLLPTTAVLDLFPLLDVVAGVRSPNVVETTVSYSSNNPSATTRERSHYNPFTITGRTPSPHQEAGSTARTSLEAEELVIGWNEFSRDRQPEVTTRHTDSHRPAYGRDTCGGRGRGNRRPRGNRGPARSLFDRITPRN